MHPPGTEVLLTAATSHGCCLSSSRQRLHPGLLLHVRALALGHPHPEKGSETQTPGPRPDPLQQELGGTGPCVWPGPGPRGHRRLSSTQGGTLTSCRSVPRIVGNTARGASVPEKPTLLKPEPQSQTTGVPIAPCDPAGLRDRRRVSVRVRPRAPRSRARGPSHGDPGGFPHPGPGPAGGRATQLDAVGSLLEGVGFPMTGDTVSALSRGEDRARGPHLAPAGPRGETRPRGPQGWPHVQSPGRWAVHRLRTWDLLGRPLQHTVPHPPRGRGQREAEPQLNAPCSHTLAGTQAARPCPARRGPDSGTRAPCLCAHPAGTATSRCPWSREAPGSPRSRPRPGRSLSKEPEEGGESSSERRRETINGDPRGGAAPELTCPRCPSPPGSSPSPPLRPGRGWGRGA